MEFHKSVPDVHDTEVVSCSTIQPPPTSYQDEPISALHNIQRLLEQHPEVAEPDDFVMLGELTGKLRQIRRHTSAPNLN